MIHVVVVESHNHALEHIHATLRQRRLLNHDWSMLHFDAHADLACPGKHIPAASCYRPHMTIRSHKQSEMNKCHRTDGSTKEVCSDDSDLNLDDDLDSVDGLNLYELLDSTSSGIAEWILPLVLAANLRSIVWVRTPNTVPLIPSGIHQYHVGVHVNPEVASPTLITNPCIPTSFLDLPLTAVVKVDWDCRYYLEDDSYVPTTDMIHSQALQLTVKEGPEEGDASTFSNCTKVQQSKSHVEDSVYNIYAVDVCLDYFLCYNPFLHDIESRSSTLAKSFHDAVTQSKLYSDSYGVSQSTGASNFAVELFTFRQHFTRFLESLTSTRLQEDLLTALLPFYDSSQIAETLLDRLQNAFNDVDGIVDELIEALPYVTMPHTWGKIDEALIQQRIMHMRKEILESHSNKTSPFIITVARSTEDGFTSRDVVDDLQDRVLYELHSVFCGCGNQIQTKRSVRSSKSGGHSSSVGAEACCWNLVLDY